MAYRTRNRISEQQQNNANPQTATAQFADRRTVTAKQLEQQTLMAESANATAQRAVVNAMNTSAVQQQKIIQRATPEEELQMKSIHTTTQLAGMDDEGLLQGKFETAQRAEDEELLQGKFETAQRADDEELLQRKFEPVEKPNNTGLPNQLKSGIENLSGMSMDHVKVHYNSEKPAQLQAHAYAQGSDIHVAPGQEKHLPHEAWHVVQQAQGRVKPTMQMKGDVPVNDDVGLEAEADVMGAKALLQRVERNPEMAPAQLRSTRSSDNNSAPHEGNAPLQKKALFLDTSNEIGELSQTIIAKKEEFRKILPEKEFTGEAAEAFEALFQQYAGPVYATLARLQRSEMDYGIFNLSDPQSLALLYFEIKKSKGDAHPNGDFVARKEDTDAEKDVKDTEKLVGDIKTNLPYGANFYKTVLLGAGASVAYYLTANARSLDLASTAVIGKLQPWAHDRGKEGRVNHPRHVISPKRDKAGPQPEDDVLMSREDFSGDIKTTLTNSGAKHFELDISSVKKVSILGREVRAATEEGIKLYEIMANDTVFYALDVIAGLGAGPHKEVNEDPVTGEQIGAVKNDLNDGLRDRGILQGHNKVMNLDEFQQNASNIYRSLQDAERDAVIFISGGSAAIDAVTRIIAENKKFDKGRKLKLIWAQGGRGAQFLEGTDNEATKREYPDHLIDKSKIGGLAAAFKGRTGEVSVNGQKVKIMEGDNEYNADLYIHAQGQNTEKLKSIFDKKTVLDKLALTYDKNQEFGTNALLPSVIGAEVEANSDENDKTSMKFIGATAESLVNMRGGPKYEAVKMAIEHAKLGIGSFNKIVSNEAYGFSELGASLDGIDFDLLVAGTEIELIGLANEKILSFPDDRKKIFMVDGIPVRQDQLRESCLGVVRYLNAMKGLKLKSDTSNAVQKLQEVVSTLPINVFTNAQLASSRSQVEAEASFVPSYVTKDIDFATDSRTVIAIHIAAKYQNLTEDDANYWANRIVATRRPSYGDIKGDPLLAEGLLGPIPNPYGESRETTSSFSAAFTQLLQEANLAAKK